MASYIIPIYNRVSLRHFGQTSVSADNILLKKLVTRRAGFLKRLLPQPGTGFALRLLGQDHRFDHRRPLHVGTSGEFGLSLRTNALRLKQGSCSIL